MDTNFNEDSKNCDTENNLCSDLLDQYENCLNSCFSCIECPMPCSSKQAYTDLVQSFKNIDDSKKIDLSDRLYEACIKTRGSSFRLGLIWMTQLILLTDSQNVISSLSLNILKLLCAMFDFYDKTQWRIDKDNDQKRKTHNLLYVFHNKVKDLFKKHFIMFFENFKLLARIPSLSLLPALPACVSAACELVQQNKKVEGMEQLCSFFNEVVLKASKAPSPLVTSLVMPIGKFFSQENWKLFFINFDSFYKRVGSDSLSFLLMFLRHNSPPQEVLDEKNISSLIEILFVNAQIDDRAILPIRDYLRFSCAHKHSKVNSKSYSLYPVSLTSAKIVSQLIRINQTKPLLTVVLQRAWDSLDGKFGALNYTYQRIGIIDCVGKIATSINGQTVSDISSHTIHRLLTSFNNESNVSAKQVVLTAIGHWSSLLSQDEFNSFVLKDSSTQTQQKGKQANKKAHESIQQTTLISFFINVTSDLHPTSMKALKCVLNNWKQLEPPSLDSLISSVNSLLSQRILANGLSHCAFFATKFEIDSMLKLFIGCDAFFNKQFVTKLTLSEARSYFSFLTHCFLSSSSSSSSSSTIDGRFIDALISLSCHSCNDVLKILQMKIYEMPKLSEIILPSFVDSVQKLCDSTSPEKNESSIPFKRLFSSLCALIHSSAIQSNPNLVPQLFILSHYEHFNPEFCGNNWKRLSVHFGNGSVISEAIAHSIIEKIVSSISSSNSFLSKATILSLGTIVCDVPSESLRFLFVELASLLSSKSFDSLTSRELQIAASPLGSLYRDPQSLHILQQLESEARQGLERAQKTKRGKNEKLDDLKWEEQVRREKEKKRKEECLKMGQKWIPVTPEDKVIAMQDEIRTRVIEISETFKRTLNGLNLIAQVRPYIVRDYLTIIIPHIQRLLSHVVLAEDALMTHLAIAKALSRNKRLPYGLTARNSFVVSRIIKANTGNNDSIDELIEDTSSVVVQVAEICNCSGSNAIASSDDIQYTQPEPLSGAEFTFFFTAIEFAMKQPYSTESKHLHACAMQLMKHHSDSESAIPRKEMALVLIDVIHEKPRYAHQALVALPLLCGGMSVEELAVLRKGVLHENPEVRRGTLDGMVDAPCISFAPTVLDHAVQMMLFIVSQDSNEVIAERASILFDQYDHPIDESFFSQLLPYLSSEKDHVREMSLRALEEALELHPNKTEDTLKEILETYRSHLPPPPEKAFMIHPDPHYSQPKKALYAFDTFKNDDEIRDCIRFGTVAAISTLANAIASLPIERAEKCYEAILEFVLSEECISDNAVPIYELSTSAQVVLDQCPSEIHKTVIPLLEKRLAMTKTKNAPANAVYQTEIIVLCFGALAKKTVHERFDTITDLLVKTLLSAPAAPKKTKTNQIPVNTSNDDEDENLNMAAGVQPSIANCLKTIAVRIENELDVSKIFEKFFDSLKNQNEYVVRGGTFGIAGLVSGIGLRAMSQYQVTARIYSFAKTPNTKYGSFLLVEQLSSFLGMLFEPYVSDLLAILLNGYSETLLKNRNAARKAAREIVSNLSPFGLKIILPALIKGTETDQWRTKTESIQLLGTMAYIAPHNLSKCLPEIVPVLVRVLSDPHDRVQNAARVALRDIAGSIGNPEIRAIEPVIIKALEDPAGSTGIALAALEATAYVHRVDPPALSLIVPIADRGLKNMKGDQKTKAAMILGNLCRLTTPEDIEPYLALVLPALKDVVLADVPHVRAVTARALANLVGGLGVIHMRSLLDWAVGICVGEDSSKISSTDIPQSSIERAGSAQVIAELLSVADDDWFSETFEQIIAKADNPSANVRDGVLCTLRFFPLTVSSLFEHYLPNALPCVLKGFSDESEVVRDSAERAANTFVTQYYHTSVDLLLPALEKGLLDPNFRIQETSLKLISALLTKIITGGQNIAVATVKDPEEVLFRKLGFEQTASVFGTLNILRSDSNISIAQTAASVWKIAVSKPSKVLTDIMEHYINQVLNLLVQNTENSTDLATKSLSSLFSRFQTKAICIYLPLVQAQIDHADPNVRISALKSLTYAVKAAGEGKFTHSPLSEFGGNTVIALLVPFVKKGLCDSSEQVRDEAGIAFGNLYHIAGTKASEEIIGPLINDLANGDKDGLSALCQIVRVKGNAVIPELMPTLFKTPLTIANIDAITEISLYTTENIRDFIARIIEENIIPAISYLNENPTINETAKEKLLKASVALCVSAGKDGAFYVLHTLDTLLRSPVRMKCKSALEFTFQYLEDSKAKSWAENSIPVEFSLHFIDFFVNPDIDLQILSSKCLDSLLGSFEKSTSPKYVKKIQEHIQDLTERIRSDGMNKSDNSSDECVIVPAFAARPRAISALLGLYTNAVLVSGFETKKDAALGIRDLFQFTPHTQMDSPILMNATGPLIRMLSERFPIDVEVAFLDALRAIMCRGREKLKYILPQLQTTITRKLKSPEKPTRKAAFQALCCLLPLGIKVRILVSDLLSALHEYAQDEFSLTISSTLLDALKETVLRGSPERSDVVRVRDEAISQLSSVSIQNNEGHSLRMSAARLVVFCVSTNEEERKEDVEVLFGPTFFGNSEKAHILESRALIIHRLVQIKTNVNLVVERKNIIFSMLNRDKTHADVMVRLCVAKAIGSCVLCWAEIVENTQTQKEEFKQLLVSLGELSADTADSVAEQALHSLRDFANENVKLAHEYAHTFFKPLVDRIERKSSARSVMHDAEYALLYLLEAWNGNAEETLKTINASKEDKKRIVPSLKRISSLPLDE